MNRIGECNRCGSCCTSEEGFPFPRNFPDVIRNWNAPSIKLAIPHYAVIGLGVDDNGGLSVVEYYGNHNILGNKIYWRWVYGKGICKNIEPYEDAETYIQECPWLLDDEGDGRRECALVGNKYEPLWEATCNANGDGMAPLTFTQAERDAWKTAHPLCGYDWE